MLIKAYRTKEFLSLRIYSTDKRKTKLIIMFPVGKLYNYVNQKITVKNIIKQF